MTTYRAPIRDMKFVIDELAGLESLATLPGYEEVNSELTGTVLEEAAKIAGEVLAPLNKLGDERGASLTKEGVVAAKALARLIASLSTMAGTASAGIRNMADRGCRGWWQRRPSRCGTHLTCLSHFVLCLPPGRWRRSRRTPPKS
jgi:hypothetical protein